MTTQNEALTSFDNCPNRRLIPYDYVDPKNPFFNSLMPESRLNLECSKYPEGTDFEKECNITDNGARARSALRLGCAGCRFATIDNETMRAKELLVNLHPLVIQECETLFLNGHYSQAVSKAYQLVKDRLRYLTGYEKATDAFGRGGLYIDGSAADHVDSDYQKAAQYLLMSIDMFRNEVSHTSNDTAKDEQMAVHKLNLASLALLLLDQAFIK